jgi:AmmeMemoRadiSam system protein B/AmmeMemoRadiSam system protein A
MLKEARPMKLRSASVIVATLALLCCCGETHAQAIDRKAAWANQLYPGNANELQSTLQDLFARAVPAKTAGNVAAIIVPHAAYIFSGGVAASGYNQIELHHRYENVFILGPSHRVGFEGASVYTDGNYVMPFGIVQVNTSLGKQLVSSSKSFSSRRDAHIEEHSIEVQLPFLQHRLGKDMRIVPIVVGASSPATCKDLANALRPYFNRKNLFVISTDFSHYPAYEDAKRADKQTADAIVSRSAENLLAAMNDNAQGRIPELATSLCGWPCVLTLLYLVENKPNIQIDLIDYKNSGDAAVGQKDKVVGYWAMAASLRTEQKKTGFGLNDEEKKQLLVLARRTIEQHVGKRVMAAPDASEFSATLQTKCGAFVTLRKNGDLRGCIGRFDASEPLFKVVQQMAIASSTEDYRFSPVTSDEIGKLELEISVLTPMQRIKSIDEFQLGKHGIYIKKGPRAGTFLPQVAAETGWSKEEFLGHCAQDKAGIGWDGWKDAELYVYEALVFSEKDLHLR